MWTIEASDDESDSQRMEGETKSQMGPGRVPVRIALLYLQIEKDGVLKLKTKCPRRGLVKRKLSDSQNAASLSPSSHEKEDNTKVNEHSTSNETLERASNKPEIRAFSYEEEEDTKPNANAPRRSLNSAKKPKKMASMTNVVNDLVRHKMLDELENSNVETKASTGSAVTNGTESSASSTVRLPSNAEPKKK